MSRATLHCHNHQQNIKSKREGNPSPASVGSQSSPSFLLAVLAQTAWVPPGPLYGVLSSLLRMQTARAAPQQPRYSSIAISPTSLSRAAAAGLASWPLPSAAAPHREHAGHGIFLQQPEAGSGGQLAWLGCSWGAPGFDTHCSPGFPTQGTWFPCWDPGCSCLAEN